MELSIDVAEQLVTNAIPHAKEMGIEFVALEDARMTIKVEQQPHFVGNPESGVIHGGVITTLLDSVSGIAVYAKTGRFEPLATLDLRIDYLKPSAPGLPIFAQAECYKATSSVAFVWGIAYQVNREDPIAHSAGSFMLSTKGASMRSKAKKETGHDLS